VHARCCHVVLSLPLLLVTAAGVRAGSSERDGHIIPPVFVKSQILKSSVQNITVRNIQVEEVFRRRPAPEFVSLPSVRQELIRPRVPQVMPVQSSRRPGSYSYHNAGYGNAAGRYRYNNHYVDSQTDYQLTRWTYRRLGR
jgi:hypothetical protein